MAEVSLRNFRPVHVDDLIRVGTRFDGGYIVTKRNLSNTQALISLGISNDWGFDADFARKKPGIAVLGVDGSVSFFVFFKKALEAAWTACRSAARGRGREAKLACWDSVLNLWWAGRFLHFFGPPKRRFIKKFVGDRDDENTIRMDRLLTLFADKSDGIPLFVKMDIEGFEYRAIPEIVRRESRINGLVIEFHDLARNWDNFLAVMEALKEKFAVIHMHGNNWSDMIPGTRIPGVLEISFLSRRLLTGSEHPSQRRYPVPGLDFPCNRDMPDCALEFD